LFNLSTAALTKSYNTTRNQSAHGMALEHGASFEPDEHNASLVLRHMEEVRWSASVACGAPRARSRGCGSRKT
jgi:hypothetical protein